MKIGAFEITCTTCGETKKIAIAEVHTTDDCGDEPYTVIKCGNCDAEVEL